LAILGQDIVVRPEKGLDRIVLYGHPQEKPTLPRVVAYRYCGLSNRAVLASGTMYRAVVKLDVDFLEEVNITDKPNRCRAKLGGMHKLIE